MSKSINDSDPHARKWGKQEESEYLIQPEVIRNGSVWGSVFNLCNSAIGAGILAIPYAVQQVGLGLGLLCILVMGIVMTYTLKIVLWAHRLQPDVNTYEKLVLHLFGKKLSLLVTFCVVLGTFGSLVGFMVIIADLLTPILQLLDHTHPWFHSRLFVVLVLSIGILPLASLERFDSLKFSSTMAIISITFTVAVVIVRSIQALPSLARSEIVFFHVDFEIWNALPIISFAFGCTLQLVPINFELKDNHIPSRPNWVIGVTNLICLVLYSVTGLFGYLEFPESTQGNVLKNYANNDTLVNVARAVLSFVIVCHYPPSNYCCREALDHLFFPKRNRSTIRRIIWTVIIWAAALVVSIAIPKINVVFGLIGSIPTTLIVIIFPAIFILKFMNDPRWEGIKGYTGYAVAISLLLFGIVLSVFGTIMSVLTSWFPQDIPT